MERINIPLNPMPDGVCRTIKNQYYKTSLANFTSQGSFGGTGVATYIPPKDIGSHKIGGARKVWTFHLPHGYLKLRASDNGICPTIDATIHYWHTLLIEYEED